MLWYFQGLHLLWGAYKRERLRGQAEDLIFTQCSFWQLFREHNSTLSLQTSLYSCQGLVKLIDICVYQSDSSE